MNGVYCEDAITPSMLPFSNPLLNGKKFGYLQKTIDFCYTNWYISYGSNGSKKHRILEMASGILITYFAYQFHECEK